MKHYHVLCGLRGMYMPDINDVYRSKRAALSGAAWWANSYREDGCEVTGSAKRGWYHVRYEGNETAHHCIEVTDCYDRDCPDDDSDY